MGGGRDRRGRKQYCIFLITITIHEEIRLSHGVDLILSFYRFYFGLPVLGLRA